MTHASSEELLSVARDAADAAADEIRPYWIHGAAVQQKPDHTPVTEADLAAENRIREVIGCNMPSGGRRPVAAAGRRMYCGWWTP